MISKKGSFKAKISRNVKFVGIICALAMMFSLSAYASNIGFGITVQPTGNWAYSSANPKSDSEQKSYINVKAKSGTAVVKACVVNASYTRCTNEFSITSTGLYTPSYTIFSGKNSNMRIAMKSTTQIQSESLSGTWNS